MNENNELANLSPEDREKYMAQVKEKLQMPAEADDFEVVARLVIMIAKMQERYDEVMKETAATQGEMANRDLATFKDVIGEEDADFWREQLIVNREPTLKVLEGLKARTKKPVVAVPMRNRVMPAPTRTAATMAGGPTAEQELKARAIANRANEIVQKFGIRYVDAFERAVREVNATTK